MIIDSSAIMAILLGEPEREALLAALVRAPTRIMSAGTWIELAAVMTRGQGRLLPIDDLNVLVSTFSIEIVPVTAAQGKIGHEAYRRYGLGTQDPAKLNFGDCFAYALAKETGDPLLFKGDDFTHTDITSAL
ncbi:type II toxin-antitoxin system VapC family toxin [Sphingomonas sp. PB4P5]|uniref:type II toxin-antitoxin system VapC family toxin n=1 Tax=Parasphingomonas puruogangriensis TaxID=3096155 RepID=UPI002FCB4FD5